MRRNEPTAPKKTVNFEINRVVSNTVREVGRVDRLSVAVLVDGIYAEGADGTLEYQPRPEEEIARLEALVRSAVGFDANRGDTIEVVNLPFVDPAEEGFETADAGLMGLTRDDIFRIAEIVVLGIVAILVILLVVRPLIGRLAESGRGAGPEDEFGGLLPGPGGMQPALAGPAGAMGALPELADPADRGLVPTGGGGGSGDDLDAMIDISQVEGRVRASSLKEGRRDRRKASRRGRLDHPQLDVPGKPDDGRPRRRGPSLPALTGRQQRASTCRPSAFVRTTAA